tara:strand:+ start:729 stop:941 length:213 start_codon:yes stop_codon:yes gene_type:complete
MEEKTDYQLLQEWRNKYRELRAQIRGRKDGTQSFLDNMIESNNESYVVTDARAQLETLNELINIINILDR